MVDAAIEQRTVAAEIQKILVPRYRVVCKECGFCEHCSSLEEAMRLAQDHDAFHAETLDDRTGS